MQQMSNILLGSSSKSADVSTKGNVQDVENTSFLSAFNQASESDLVIRRSGNTAQVSMDAEVDKTSVALANELSTEENADAELIFAQLNMADLFNKRHSSGGNELPHVDKSDVYFDAAVSTEPKSNTVDVDLLELEADVSSIKDVLSQLSPEELDNLMAFADLSAQDLQALDNQDLSKLLSDFNLQAQVMTSSNESPDSVLNSEEQSQIDKSVATSVAVQGQVSATNQSLATAKVDKTVASGVSRSAALTAATSAMTIDPETILGDKTRIDGNIQLDTDNAKVLAKADFSVVLDSLAAKRASGDPSTAVNQTSFGLDTLADIGDTDSKALQNQSSFTSVHKSDVPQFQLSLRPQGEPGAQMQEMIQRFSPVMKQQLITMVSNGIQQAEIRLDPPELGHLTVKIQIQGDQTQVQFHVAQSQTRDIVEQAMPRLRDMLAQEGLQLTDSQVSQGDGGSEQQHEQSSNQGGGDSQLDEISAQEVSLMTNPSRSLHSAIDYYA
ncbi:flagellar hook-length control protein FliK [Shewanella sp. BF02_Schw]|uniref:flagellar hook-length control protein FliK n=1 Tax=Shewanella sp. BF02_Schw TaxID=394908 RepID=UPI00177C3FED|nr:flagellar hook-length control protein FliK [Shewanella sp. BF02_Schw]MBO1894739.1 flagellar hook-length control protein FliK [Shewanella sp. BF02_Schw]